MLPSVRVICHQGLYTRNKLRQKWLPICHRCFRRCHFMKADELNAGEGEARARGGELSGEPWCIEAELYLTGHTRVCVCVCVCVYMCGSVHVLWCVYESERDRFHQRACECVHHFNTMKLTFCNFPKVANDINVRNSFSMNHRVHTHTHIHTHTHTHTHRHTAYISRMWRGCGLCWLFHLHATIVKQKLDFFYVGLYAKGAHVCVCVRLGGECCRLSGEGPEGSLM